jgi:hypothetical protein
MRRFLSYGLLAIATALGGLGPGASASPGGACAGLADTNCYYDSNGVQRWCGVWAAGTCVQPTFTISPRYVAVSGSGTIDPGLPCPSATGCNVELSFTALFAGPAATASCTFSGRDTTLGGGTVLHGEGWGTITCSGGVSASGRVTFSRDSAVVNVGDLITVNGSTCWVGVTLAFVPGGPPPVTSFSVHGGGTLTCS